MRLLADQLKINQIHHRGLQRVPVISRSLSFSGLLTGELAMFGVLSVVVTSFVLARTQTFAESATSMFPRVALE
jgi:hypothetical protein